MAGLVVALGAVIVVAASLAAKSSPSKQDASAPAAPLTVGWEASFGFTDSFDPTGEYLGDAWGIYSNLLVAHAHGLRTTCRAPRATSSSPTSRRRCRSRPNGGKTYTFKLKSGIKFARR